MEPAGAKARRGAPSHRPWGATTTLPHPPPQHRGRCRFLVSLSWGRLCLRSLLGLESRPGFRQRVPPARPLPGRLSPCAALCIAPRPCLRPRQPAEGGWVGGSRGCGKFGLPRNPPPPLSWGWGAVKFGRRRDERLRGGGADGPAPPREL